MKIGVDLSSLQGPHRMRGIGYTLLNLINNIPAEERTKYKFVFFVLPADDSENPLDLLNLDGLSYEVRDLRPRRRIHKKLPGRLNMIISTFNQLVEIRDLYFGDSRVTNLDEVDVYLQTDQSQSLPRGRNIKKFLVVYDVIPYALSWDYLWTYRHARRKRGFSRKASLRCHVRRWLYAYKLRINLRRAHKLIAISKHTKADFIRYFSVPPRKIEVSALGVNEPLDHTGSVAPVLHEYHNTSWGYMKSPMAPLTDTPFILFVGGVDRRRKIEDLVTAFNRIRASGQELKLVLAGDSMRGPDNVATEETQTALRDSAYQSDIVYMGFINDIERDWLYKHALAFVFPSRYEGFGLPVLEAMMYGCPVISYKNAATQEVGEDVPIYTTGSLELTDAITTLLQASKETRKQLAERGKTQAQKYRWDKTARQIIGHLVS